MKEIFNKYYNEDAVINIYVANLAAYNDGYLMGAWLALPATENEINEVLEGIKGNYPELEYAIHDYETNIGLEIDEYESIDNLNELAQDLEDLEDYELEAAKAYIEVNGGDIRNAIESINRCTFYENMTLEDLAYELVEEGCYGEINESIKSYIDYSAIARDLGFDNYHEVSNGVIYIG